MPIVQYECNACGRKQGEVDTGALAGTLVIRPYNCKCKQRTEHTLVVVGGVATIRSTAAAPRATVDAPVGSR